MKKIKQLLATGLLLVASVALAGEEGAEMEKPSFAATQSMTVTATVEAINPETRVATVRTADGEEITFTASEDARNLDQVSVGDILVTQFSQTVTVDVVANDGMGPEAAEAMVIARTEEGEMPGVAAMDAVVVISTVEEINLEQNTFKLKDPNGDVTEYAARNPENLKRAEVGDLVVITITDSVVIAVEKTLAE